MSDRGTLVIDVQHGLGEVLAVLDAQWWPESIVDERGRWLPIDDQQVWRAHPGQAGTVTFTDVAHPTVVDLLADALLATLDASLVMHQTRVRGRNLTDLAATWELTVPLLTCSAKKA